MLFSVGTSYIPPVKRKVKSSKNQEMPNESFSGRNFPFSRAIGFLRFSTNLSLRRTMYLIVTFLQYGGQTRPSIIPNPDYKVQVTPPRRGGIVPPEVNASTLLLGLSRRMNHQSWDLKGYLY